MRDLPAAAQPAGKLHLSARHRATIEALLRKHLPDVEVWAYGSRVNGQSHDGSDLDLVLRGPGLAKIDDSRLADFMEAVGESTVPFLVEAYDWASLPERFHRQIERDNVVFVEKDRSRQVVWPEKRIEEIAEKIAMGPFGSSIRVNTFVPEGIPIISGQHLHGVRVDDSPGFNFITEEHAERLKNANVQRGDIVFSHRGTVGQVAYVPDDSTYDRYVVSQSQFYLRCDRRQVIPQFIAYYFKTHEGRHRLLANTSQVGVPSIAQPVSYLRSISIPLPPLEEQRAIVHVLEKIDDKIELNRRMNETLEEMARALFKSWFVDFDPVRAKMEGRDTGLPAHVADLFPDRLTDSELGRTPAAWQIGTLGDVAVSPWIGVDPAELPDDTLYIGLEHMPRRSVALTDWASVGSVSSRKSAFKKGDILFGKLRPYFHKVGIAPVNGVCSTDILVLRAHVPALSSFVLTCVSSPDFVAYASRTSTGTKMPRTNWKTMSGYRLCVPTGRVRRAFHEAIKPILERIVRNVHESRALAAVRDGLLPKLVSGQLQCKSSTGRTER